MRRVYLHKNIHTFSFRLVPFIPKSMHHCSFLVSRAISKSSTLALSRLCRVSCSRSFSSASAAMGSVKCFFDIAIAGQPAGRIAMNVSIYLRFTSWICTQFALHEEDSVSQIWKYFYYSHSLWFFLLWNWIQLEKRSGCSNVRRTFWDDGPVHRRLFSFSLYNSGRNGMALSHSCKKDPSFEADYSSQ